MDGRPHHLRLPSHTLFSPHLLSLTLSHSLFLPSSRLQVSRLPQLMVLELSGNQLTRVEDFIENMTMLKELDLSGNLLNHVSDTIGLLPNLEVRAAGDVQQTHRLMHKNTQCRTTSHPDSHTRPHTCTHPNHAVSLSLACVPRIWTSTLCRCLAQPLCMLDWLC